MLNSMLKLRLITTITWVLVFGALAGIIGLILYAAGVSGSGGILAWIFISLLFLAIQWYFGPALILRATGAKPLNASQYPKLYESVRNLAKNADIPMPKLYMVNNPTPNAFAFGRTQKSSAIAVHSGLLNALNEDEVEAVLAHEVGHIKNRDVAIMTVASALPVMLYYLIILFVPRDRNSGMGSFLGVFIGGLVAQFFGQLLVMWLSRNREYFADEFSARLTQKPLNLMSALTKITYASQKSGRNKNVMSLYISNSSEDEKRMMQEIANALSKGNAQQFMEKIKHEKRRLEGKELLMTHPLTVKRLEALWRIKKEITA